jgi:hypothetical protein
MGALYALLGITSSLKLSVDKLKMDSSNVATLKVL